MYTPGQCSVPHRVPNETTPSTYHWAVSLLATFIRGPPLSPLHESLFSSPPAQSWLDCNSTSAVRKVDLQWDCWITGTPTFSLTGLFLENSVLPHPATKSVSPMAALSLGVGKHIGLTKSETQRFSYWKIRYEMRFVCKKYPTWFRINYCYTRYYLVPRGDPSTTRLKQLAVSLGCFTDYRIKSHVIMLIVQRALQMRLIIRYRNLEVLGYVTSYMVMGVESPSQGLNHYCCWLLVTWVDYGFLAAKLTTWLLGITLALQPWLCYRPQIFRTRTKAMVPL